LGQIIVRHMLGSVDSESGAGRQLHELSDRAFLAAEEREHVQADRYRAVSVGDEVEARVERILDHLQRPLAGR